MQQLARWYDIEVVYPNGIPEKYFAGEMSRDLTLGEVLKTLETTRVHFKMEGSRRLVVLP